MYTSESVNTIRVAELFAGVGGFRIGLEKASDRFLVTFSNQWEPGRKNQFASQCYERNFRNKSGVCEGHHNEDIENFLNRVEAKKEKIGPFELIVGGFPCQDYSVAKPKNRSHGLRGRKGVLWWQIYRLLLILQRDSSLPRWLFFENVDRLIKSPSSRKGRDFAVMLFCLNDLGYEVEWRVINAADYGFPQKRRRVLIVGKLISGGWRNHRTVMEKTGILAKVFPVKRMPPDSLMASFQLQSEIQSLSESFGRHQKRSPFENTGFMSNGRIWTAKTTPNSRRKKRTLGDCLEPSNGIPQQYFIPNSQLQKWRDVKKGKKESRISRFSGIVYNYQEGSLPMPDDLHKPARTILTSEGGITPSRTKHIVQQDAGQPYRRLLPVELERLNGFPRNWTRGMTDTQRAFCMGNALVIGLVTAVAKQILHAQQMER